MDSFEELLIKNKGTQEPEPTPAEPAKPAEPVVEPKKEEITPEAGEEAAIEPTPSEGDQTSSNEPVASSEEGTEPPVEAPTEPSEEGTETVFDDWDVTETPEAEVPEEAVNVDSSVVLKDLGLEGLTVDEAKNRIQQLKDAEGVDPLSNLPENLKQAIKLAQNDGDWLQFLGVNAVDYNSIDDSVLLANSLAPYFTDAEGKIDKEGLEDYMEGMTEVDKQIRARQMKDELIAKQAAQSKQFEVEATQRRVEADRDLKAALDATEEIRGLKLKPNHKKKIYDGISTGDMIKEMFFDKQGKMDFNKVIDHYFNHLYGKQADTYLRQRITSSTKKDMLDKLGNVQVQPKPSDMANAAPEEYNSQKALANHLTGN